MIIIISLPRRPCWIFSSKNSEVPSFEGFVERAGGEGFTIGGEGDGVDRVRVASEGMSDFSCEKKKSVNERLKNEWDQNQRGIYNVKKDNNDDDNNNNNNNNNLSQHPKHE